MAVHWYFASSGWPPWRRSSRLASPHARSRRHTRTPVTRPLRHRQLSLCLRAISVSRHRPNPRQPTRRRPAIRHRATRRRSIRHRSRASRRPQALLDQPQPTRHRPTLRSRPGRRRRPSPRTRRHRPSHRYRPRLQRLSSSRHQPSLIRLSPTPTRTTRQRWTRRRPTLPVSTRRRRPPPMPRRRAILRGRPRPTRWSPIRCRPSAIWRHPTRPQPSRFHSSHRRIRCPPPSRPCQRTAWCRLRLRPDPDSRSALRQPRPFRRPPAQWMPPGRWSQSSCRE